MLHAISYFMDARDKKISDQIAAFLTKEKTVTTDLASFDLPDITTEDVVIAYGDKAKKLLPSINARIKIDLPALQELDATYGVKEVREVTFEKLKKIKESLDKPAPVAEKIPEPVTKLTVESTPANLKSADILHMLCKALKDKKDWTGVTQDGKTIRLTVEPEKGKADINMTFAELYMLRLAIETLKVKSFEIITKSTK